MSGSDQFGSIHCGAGGATGNVLNGLKFGVMLLPPPAGSAVAGLTAGGLGGGGAAVLLWVGRRDGGWALGSWRGALWWGRCGRLARGAPPGGGEKKKGPPKPRPQSIQL